MKFHSLASIVLAIAMATPVNANEHLPEVDTDGLHLVKDSKVRVAYIRSGASLSKYDKLIILDCFVEFREHWKRDYNLKQVGLTGRVDSKDMAEIKTKLAAEFKSVFSDELQEKGGYPIVDTAGPDVLLVRPAILNLDAVAPDVGTAPTLYWTIVDSAGSMTLYMELYDSETSELIARVIDPRTDRWGGLANRTANKQAADQILRHWAKLFREALDDVK